jgi:hypothetical protein
MKTFDTKDIPGTLSVLQSEHHIVSLCGHEGAQGTNLLKWEHWLTLSGLLVLPQAVYPTQPSKEEQGMLAFMRTQRVLRADALIVVTNDNWQDTDYQGTIDTEDMQLVVVALHAGKPVFTSSYVGRHRGPDAEEAVFSGKIAAPLRCLDLTAPPYLFRLEWEDLQANNRTHNTTVKELTHFPKVGNHSDMLDVVATNGANPSGGVAAQRPTTRAAEEAEHDGPPELLTQEIQRAQQPRG